MFVLKNRCVPELSEAYSHARLSHWKQFLKNIHPLMLASFWFTDENIFTVATPKNLQNAWLYAHPSTKKKDVMTKWLHTQRSVTDGISRRRSASLVDIAPVCYLSITESRIVTSINSNVMLLQQFLPDLKRVLHLSARHCPSAQGTWCSQLSRCNLAKSSVILKILSKQI